MVIEELELQEEQQEGFVIDDNHKANWALKKIREHKAKQRENEEFAQEEIEQIEQWLEGENEKLQKKIDFLENALHYYFMKLREKDPKLKTHSLPFGKLQMRKQPPAYKYDDNRLLKFLHDAGIKKAIRVKESPDKTQLKKITTIVGNKLVIKETGEVVEGVVVEQMPEKFSVKVKED